MTEGETQPMEKKNSKNVRLECYIELGERGMDTVKLNVEDAMPVDNEWSLPILFRSEVSAQHFFLIHRFFEAEWGVQGAEDQVS